MHFDARAAKALEPGKHIVVQGCPGLRLEASQTKKTWTYRYRSPVSGKLRQVKIGGWPAVPPAQAAARWQALRDRRDAGKDPADEKKSARHAEVQAAQRAKVGPYTLGRMVDDYHAGYLLVHRQLRGATQVHQRLKKHLAKYLEMPAEETSRRMVFGVIEALLAKPVLARSIKSEMSAAWRFAVESESVSEDLPNWWAAKTSHKLRSKGAVREGRNKGTGKRVLSADELRTLLTVDLALFSQQVRDFLVLQLWTCTRGAEICQMRRGQISEAPDGLWWQIPKEMMKVRKVAEAFALRVPLAGQAEVVVRRLLQREGELLFPSVSRLGEVRPQTQGYMQTKVHYLQPYSNARPDHKRQRLQVTHWSPHDLRRTGRTMLAALGCPHDVGESILGHVVPGVAGDYNLYRFDAERRIWLDRLSLRLGEIYG